MSWPTCLNICTVSILLVLEIRVCHVGLWIYCTSFYIKTLINSQLRFPKKHFRPSFRLKPWAISLRESTQQKMYHNVAIFRHTYTMTCFSWYWVKPKSPSWVWWYLYCIVLIFVAHLFRPELRLPPTPFWKKCSCSRPGHCNCPLIGIPQGKQLLECNDPANLQGVEVLRFRPPMASWSQDLFPSEVAEKKKGSKMFKAKVKGKMVAQEWLLLKQVVSDMYLEPTL